MAEQIEVCVSFFGQLLLVKKKEKSKHHFPVLLSQSIFSFSKGPGCIKSQSANKSFHGFQNVADLFGQIVKLLLHLTSEEMV